MSTPEKFSTHRSPVWRDKADFIINAELPEADRFEQLWTRRTSDATFEVCCIPFFLYDVALGDIVRTRRSHDRDYMFAEVVQPSGRFVFRADFGRSAHPVDEIVGELTGLGATMEWSSATLLAIDAEDLPHAQQIADVLQARANLGHLVFETGNS